MKIPKTSETLDPFAQHRTWTSLSVMMNKGMTDRTTIVGLVGSEIGIKFEGFLKTDVDLEELIQVPSGFHSLEFDARYMVSVMLATWLTKHIKDVSKAFGLLDTMFVAKHEFVVLVCLCMSKFNAAPLLKQLFDHDPQYKDVLTEISIGIKDQITA